MTELLIVTLLIGLATYRLWRVVAVDSISEPFRHWLGEKVWKKRTNDRRKVWWEWFLDLLICVWCLGWWIAGALTLIWFGWSLEVLLVWPAASAIAGYASALLTEGQ